MEKGPGQGARAGAGRQPLRAALAVGWALLIAIATSIPGDSLPEGPDVVNLDKLVHLAIYAVLGVLVARAAGPGAGRAWTALLICVLYGAADELHQAFIPLREPSLLDALADAIGAAFGVGLQRSMRQRAAKRERTKGAEDETWSTRSS